MNDDQAMNDAGAGPSLPPPVPGTQIGAALPDYVESAGGGDRAPTRPRRGRKRIVVAVAVGAGLLLLPIAGALALRSGDDGGASTPEGAVQAMFDAVGNEDVLGVMDTLLPGERRSLGEPLQDVVGELERLRILSDEADLGDVEGIDLEFDDLTFATEEISDGIAVVELTGGTVEGQADLDELPLGDLLLDLGFEGERPSGSEAGSEPIGDGLRVATVEEDGRWYVSLWFSVAEAARSGADLAPPDTSDAIAPTGSDSPEAVVDDLLAAAGALDLEAVLAMLPPGEARALHVYAPLFLADAQAELDQLRDESRFALTVEESEYDVDQDGDRATVAPTTLAARIEVDGEEIAVSIADGCTTIEADGEREDFCADDVEDALEDAGLDDAEELGPLGNLGGLGGLAGAGGGFEVVEEDGRWYLSPTSTVLRPFVAALESLEEDDIRTFVDSLEEVFSVDVDSAVDTGSGSDTNDT